MALPPTSTNLLHHMLRAHLQVMLWKAADHQAPPDESANITHFGWDIQDSIPGSFVSRNYNSIPSAQGEGEGRGHGGHLSLGKMIFKYRTRKTGGGGGRPQAFTDE